MAPRSLPPVDSLRCFLAVAGHLSFRRAASELALTPGAVSQRVRQLEALLEVQLFERTSRQVELTADGHQLRPTAQAAVEAVAACMRPDAGAPTRLSLGTRFELGLSWIVPAVLELRRARPTWQVDLVFGSGREILDRLEAGTVDAIVTSAPTANARWAARALHEETYALVAAPRRLETAPIEEPADVGAHVLLDLDRSLPLARYAQSVSPELTLGDVWCCGTAAAVRDLACAGQGVAVLPEYMIRADLEAGRLVRCLPELALLRDTFRLLYRTGGPAAEALETLGAFLSERPLT